MSILLVDDHRIVREGLHVLLAQQSDFEIVGEAGDGIAALQEMERRQPAVVIMDVELPDVDGVVLSGRIIERWPAVRIVILSAVLDRRHLDDALRMGVAGYVLKSNAPDELVDAIRRAMRGETYVSREVSAILVGGYREMLAIGQKPGAGLSDRETEVLKLISSGRNTKEIAGDLGLSVKTIETHRMRIMSRLGMHSVAELTKYAIRKGLTSP